MFSGEEQYGKCLDLHIFFDTYINLKPSNKEAKKDEAKDRIDYITYLDLFYLFNDDLTRKENKEYKKYISELNDYLVNFYKKSHPLTDTAKVLHVCFFFIIFFSVIFSRIFFQFIVIYFITVLFDYKCNFFKNYRIQEK